MPTALMLASAAAERKLEVNGALKVVELFGEGSGFWLTESVIVQWIVILILLAVVLILRHNLKPVPETRRQAAAEMLVEFVRDTVHGTMGEKYNAYTPYIMTLLCYIMINNLMGLMGLRNPTADISVTGTFAIMTFILVQYNRAKTGKFKSARIGTSSVRQYGCGYRNRRTYLLRARKLRSTCAGSNVALLRCILSCDAVVHLHYAQYVLYLIC